MGLTIHYTLHIHPRAAADVRQLVEQLRQRALDLQFERVGELLDLSGAACDWENREPGRPPRWILVQAARLIEHEGYEYNVPPTRLLGFSTLPADGSEPANFGLCKYPGTITDRYHRRIRTDLEPGWYWASFCKTQYASNPADGDVQNFLRAHLSVVRLLDHARDLDIPCEVFDEGGYWEGWDVKALAEEVGHWNAMIAGFVGGMKDLLGGEGVEAPITKFPNYEHLEAEGRDEGAD